MDVHFCSQRDLIGFQAECGEVSPFEQIGSRRSRQLYLSSFKKRSRADASTNNRNADSRTRAWKNIDAEW
jgi:hypothetical protein